MVLHILQKVLAGLAMSAFWTFAIVMMLHGFLQDYDLDYDRKSLRQLLKEKSIGETAAFIAAIIIVEGSIISAFSYSMVLLFRVGS